MAKGLNPFRPVSTILKNVKLTTNKYFEINEMMKL